MSSEPRNTSSTTLTAATMSAARRAQPKLSTLSTPSVRSAAIRRMRASATNTSRKPRRSVSGNRRAARTGGMTAFSAATITAMSSAPQKSSMWTPGRIPAATIKAMPVASHETRRENGRQRGRSGFQAVEWPYVGSGSLDIRFSFSSVACALWSVLHTPRRDGDGNRRVPDNRRQPATWIASPGSYDPAAQSANTGSRRHSTRNQAVGRARY